MSVAKKKDVKSASMIHQLKVTLLGTKPPIWRRIQVPSDFHLDVLHEVLQVVMGWEGGHLHQFQVGERYLAGPEAGLFGEENVDDEGAVTLREAAPAVKGRIQYEYDFGDGWLHEILVEKLLEADPALQYPLCLAGKRACPPEDCGGVPGYEYLLTVIQDPRHPEHEEMLEWVGEDFDPERFDPEAVNRIFHPPRRARKKK